MQNSSSRLYFKISFLFRMFAGFFSQERPWYRNFKNTKACLTTTLLELLTTIYHIAMGWNISGRVLLFSNISILTQISLADRINPISTREISCKNKNVPSKIISPQCALCSTQKWALGAHPQHSSTVQILIWPFILVRYHNSGFEAQRFGKSFFFFNFPACF